MFSERGTARPRALPSPTDASAGDPNVSTSPDDPTGGHAALLFTAFEPSGDAHAAPVIRQLRAARPDLTIYAWGGPRMAAAGATLIEDTVGDPAMGLGAIRKARSISKHTARIRRWSRAYRVLGHVAVDSPAANWAICKHMKKTGARVTHLVAPQVWAWGRWRVRKLRRCTDLVLCLLPFEEQFFTERGIPSKFIGHPRINRELDEATIRALRQDLPGGTPRIAIFPGSRPAEITANVVLLARVFEELRSRHATASGLIVAASPEIARRVRRKLPEFPTGLHMATSTLERDLLDAAIDWSDVCLAVSGTVSMDITRHRRPMVGVYKTNPLSVLGAKLLLRTPHRLLPNIIAGRAIVPEFVPYAGGPGPVAAEAARILGDSKIATIQTEELGRVLYRYAHRKPDEEAARLIVKLITRGSINPQDEQTRAIPRPQAAGPSSGSAPGESTADAVARHERESPRRLDG